MAINNNSLEQLLEAIDIIASQRASENNAYDQTIICTIVDNSKAEQYGYYTVTNDTLTFQAYSDNLTYKVGNYVRVSIPNGDYSQQKYITGLYQYNTGEAVSYVSPLDTFMGISTLIDGRATPTSDTLVNQPIDLIANGNDNRGNDIPPVIIGSVDTSMQASGMYDTIGLQADFKCALGSQYNIRSGSYGLQLDLTIKLDGTNQTVIHSIYMDSANFFGDPYNFKVYSTQAQTYDISNLGGTIVSFVAKPYQRDDFTYETNGTIVCLPASEQGANIFVANIYVALGNDLYKVENHTVKLYTNNSLSYKHSSENGDLEALNTKTLSVLYYNKDENNEYIGFNDGRLTDKNNRYSELSYLGAVEDDRRLRGQRGTDIPDTFGTLDMLDRYYKILPVIDETIGYVETTVVRTLQSLKRELTGCGAVNAIVDGWVTALGSNIGAAKDARKALVKSIFAEDGKVIEKWTVTQIDIDFFDFSDILDANYWPIFDGDIFAPEIKRVVTEDYPQYRSIYEDYTKQMIEIRARVEEACARIANETWAMHVCKDTQGTAFIEKDFSVYDNYYDIFWYRENPTWTAPDRFMPTGWEPINQGDIGLPTEEDLDKPGYLVKYCPNDRNNITIVLNGDTKKERFRVVIVHNHNCYYSNILEFTNVDEFAEEEIMTSEAIELKHGEHSRESYQMLYSSGYQLINRADARLDRAIELACKGEFGGNESLCGATVYWYIPANLTMLTYDEELLTTKGLVKLDESETEGPYQYFRPGYHCFYKQVIEKPVENADPEALDKWAAALTEDLKFYYNIKENLVPCNVHNDIECVVVLNDKNKTTLEASIRVVFGALGTNGTNYSLVVMPATKQYCVTNNDPMPIDIALYDYDGNWVEDATFETSWNGPTNYTYNGNQVGMTNPDEENPNNDTGVGILTVKTTIGIESPKEGGRDRIVDLFVQYPISWGIDKGYYIAGATTITYNNNGSNPEYYKGPYVLYDKNHQEQTDIKWDIEWYDSSQGLIDSFSDPSKGYEFYKNYMPVLTNNNTIVPSPMYVTGCECYPVVVARQNGNEVWRQPIVITQNRYPSQYLNQWDGSLEIDEKNGTIMSNLVGAGKKEEDNSFSGVLMGEVAMKAKIDPEKDPVQNHNHSGLGLYGFHYGAQSFGFNVDGTAFIGKSGGGRISFDGNQGFIYSDNWLQSFEGSSKRPFIHNSDGYYELGEGTDGMAIDLHSGHIDANNFRLRSENIKMSSGRALDDKNKYIINFETSKQMRLITELMNIENISVQYYELVDGVYAPRSKDEATEILNNNGILYTTLHCNEYDYNKNKYDFPGFSENKQYYIKNADGTYVKYVGDPLEFKEGSVLYDFVDKGHGCYYIRFDKDGNLDLSISDGTFLADSGLTLKEYFDKIRNDTTIYIEDEVIGIPPELEADTVYDFITSEVDRIENDVIGFPPEDLEKGTIYSYVNAQEYLTTEGVFNGLTDNGNKLGIFSVDKNEDGNIEELYINASYIATGILRSANWNGILTYYPDNGDPVEYKTDDVSDAITKAEEAIVNGQASWSGKWSIVADEGTYWDLNNGQLFAKRFELNALDTAGNGLYLSNNQDSNKPWLFVGNGDNFIEMTTNDGLQIKTSQLSVDAWDKREYNNKIYDCGIILDSSIYNRQQPWLLVGSQQTNSNGDVVDGNFIQFTKNNDLTIQIGSGAFILNAWNGVDKYQEGIYINSKGYNTGNDNKVYFRAGTVRQDESIDASNLIEVSDERLLIKTTNLVVDAYDDRTGGIYLNSAPDIHSNGNETTKDSYLYMGDTTHFIQYTGESNLKINVNELTVDAYNDNEGIYLNSNPVPGMKADGITPKDYYFILGNEDNFIQLDGNGNLTFQTNENFIINAWDDNTGGIYLNNNPSPDDLFYLNVGLFEDNNKSFIAITEDGQMSLTSWSGEYELGLGEGFFFGHYADAQGNPYSEFYVGDKNNFIYYHPIDPNDGNSDKILQIQVEDLIIGGAAFNEAVSNAMSGPELIEALQTSGLQGIVKQDGKFYISSSYLLVKDDNNNTLFLADGINNSVEIAGWNITQQGFSSLTGAMHIGTQGITCAKQFSPEYLSYVSTNRYSIYTSGNYVRIANLGAGWYNFAYKILNDEAFTIITDESNNIEYFIMEYLPTGATNGYSHRIEAHQAGGNSYTVPESYMDYYLVINKQSSVWPFGVSDNILFSLTPADGLRATKATISGYITADSLYANTTGEIAGWKINQSTLSSSSSEVVFNSNKNLSEYAIAVKDKFLVKFDGTISATKGDIAGWQITSSSLHNNNKNIYLSSSGPGFDSLIYFDDTTLQPESSKAVMYTNDYRELGTEKFTGLLHFFGDDRTRDIPLPMWASSGSNNTYGYMMSITTNSWTGTTTLQEQFKSINGDDETSLQSDFTMRFSNGSTDPISFYWFSFAFITSVDGEYRARFQLLTEQQFLTIQNNFVDHPLYIPENKPRKTYQWYLDYVKQSSIEFSITLNKCGRNFMLLEDGSVYMTGMNCGSWDFGGASLDGSYIRGTHIDEDGYQHRVWLYSEVLKYTKFDSKGNIKFTAGCTWEQLFNKLGIGNYN